MYLRIKTLFYRIVLIGSIFLLTGSQAISEDEQSLESRLDFSLPVPVSTDHQQYLGVSGKTFTLGQVDADILIIEIFSMYCPFCQKEAPNVNWLYDLTKEKSTADRKIKLIGIGAGNSEFEVDFFKEKFEIPFPLFSDDRFTLHDKIGQVRTPHFFGLKINQDSSFKVFYSKAGIVGEPELFLENILEQAGQEK